MPAKFTDITENTRERTGLNMKSIVQFNVEIKINLAPRKTAEFIKKKTK